MANKLFDGFRRRVSDLVRGRSFPLYFTLSLAYHAMNDGWHRRKFREQNDCRKLRQLDISNHKSSDTLFILGSGASVNEYSEEQWDTIAEHDSLGFNFWLVHDFVPTYYIGEFPGGSNETRKETFYKLVEQRANDYTSVPFIIKDIHGTSFELSTDRFPSKIRDNVYIPITLQVPAARNTPALFRRSLELLNRLGIFEGSDRVRYIFHKRSSIIDVTLFGLMCGYDNIVLCGVDFNENPYFYLENKDYYEKIGRPVPTLENKTGEEHRSIDPDVGELSAPELLTLIRKHLARPNGVSISVGAKSSRLYPEFSYHFE